MKISYLEARVEAVCVHKVGNKSVDEGLNLSTKPLVVQEETKRILLKYFLGSLQTEELYQFASDSEVALNNEVYRDCKQIFQSPQQIHRQSVVLAKYLYANSVHPKIKAGEFYVIYFRDCVVDGKRTEAIGLFKSENKDTFLKVYANGADFEIESEMGININKLDKGCLVLNVEEESGYAVAVVDHTNRGVDAKYWTDDFLHVRPYKDSYTQTQQLLSLCKSFVAQLPTEQGKMEKAAYLNRSLQALQGDAVDVSTFAQQVFEKPKLISDFKQFRQAYQKEKEVEIDEHFKPAAQALKRKAMGTMTTIRLDANFDINIHGGEQYIERGYDEERGLFYYQLFFKEEK